MTTATVTVAVCQFASVDDRAANRERIAALVARAAERGARLVVLPEYSSYFVDPMDETLAANAEELDGAFTLSLRELADLHGVVIVAGLVERADAERIRNTLVAVDGTGLLAVYRKQHLYDAFGQSESRWIEAGEVGAAATFAVDGLAFGLMTCYDLRFPEVARTLVDAGAEALVVPAEWVRGPLKEHHWTTLLAARAIESTAYVVAADHPTPVGVGHSAVIDPQGVVIAGVGTGEGIAVAELDAATVARVREVNPVLRLRRYRVVPR
ncbi:MAG: hydrolase [Microbacterium sp. 14-71-5]|jgi:predicted amidohydrolase|uniref:carbon-nitrogen hydrolase family protein n=1 Tax=Microbacterium sp. 13-71-7 TaxID=1970399 RepID=UPI000BC624AB|nr:carbon-nitrogen hydrolase family protein [Microbacterium sp. 13-71-7]OZB82144.1 MAG: hydrolase [Microbacterium sp. 13-71-7]OZB89739.1 MAG: hydrolase [Microbacterium sp. 14-71-5]